MGGFQAIKQNTALMISAVLNRIESFKIYLG